MKQFDDTEQRMDAHVMREMATAHTVRVPTPLDALMAKEGESDEDDSIHSRIEAFRGMMDYLFSHGPDPAQVLRRISQLAKVLHHALGESGLADVTVVDGRGSVPTVRIQWQTEGGTSLGSLMELAGADEAGEFDRTWLKSLDFICRHGTEPIQVLRTVFAIAKAIRPEVIGDMSMDEIAFICADKGKATVSARIQRVYNEPVSEVSRGEVRASCQKAGNYSDPQRGNHNRRGLGKVVRHQDLSNFLN